MQTKTIKSALFEAIKQSDLKPRQRLRIRLLLRLRPLAANDIAEFIHAIAVEKGLAVGSSVDDALADEIWLEIIKLILEHLPEILELIFKLIG